MANPRTQASASSLVSGIKTFLKVAFAAALIYWMIHKGALDLNSFAKLATPLFLVFWAACIFLQIFANNFRWLFLLRGQGIRTSTRHTLPLSFIGMFFNFVMPGGVGGDVVKGYYLLQDYPEQRLPGAISIFMDRMMGFFVMIAMAFCALFFNWSVVSQSPELRALAFGVSLLFIAFLVFFYLSLSKILQHPALYRFLFQTLPGGEHIHRVYEMLHSYRRSPGALLHAIWISALSQVFTVAFVYLVGVALHIDVPLSGYLFLVPIGQVAQALPISPAGLGVGQAAFYYLFNSYLHRPTPLGPTAITAIQAMSFGWGLLGAFFYLRRKKPTPAGLEEVAALESV